jgi:hypothetical protein
MRCPAYSSLTSIRLALGSSSVLMRMSNDNSFVF